MKAELSEAIPGLSRIYAGTLINRAWRVVQDSNLWSFQLGQGGFSTPNITTAGSVTVTGLGQNTLVGDAVASAAWLALPLYWQTTLQQIRITGYSIYSIVAMDATDPTAVILTLDRNFVDPLPFLAGNEYQMFQAYIAAPPRFKRWLNVADMFNCWAMDIWTSRRDVNQWDPARLYTSNPDSLLPLGTDMRAGSSTFGQMLYELYPNPSTQISYQTYYVADAPVLVNNSDTLPYPITQDVVLTKARVYAYEWAESRKDVMAAKGSGANYSALKKEGEAEFLSRLKTLRLIDKDQVDSYNLSMNSYMGGCRMPYFNSQIGRANMGGIGAWR
jgi:hypothetical protein